MKKKRKKNEEKKKKKKTIKTYYNGKKIKTKIKIHWTGLEKKWVSEEWVGIHENRSNGRRGKWWRR